jgi:hypothetical protein
MSQLKTTKLSTDNYKRPKLTFTDKLTKEDIEDKLEDYKQVDDIYRVPLGTHVRYFLIDKGKKKFRTGGLLHRNDGLPVYVILSNGRNTWSVQVKNTIFYRKMTLKEIKNEYDEYIDELEKKNKSLKQMIGELKKKIKKKIKNYI